MPLPPIPLNPGEEKLTGIKQIALFATGSDSPEACRQTTMLAIEVPPERRIPTFKEGRHRCSFKSWIRGYYAGLAGAGVVTEVAEPVSHRKTSDPRLTEGERVVVSVRRRHPNDLTREGEQ